MDFFNTCKRSGHDVTLIITADHGYPLFQDPIRDITFNQTYTDAFHIPYIVTSTSKNFNLNYRNDHLALNTDSNLILKSIITKQFETLDFQINSMSRDYILCEYAGPGCPDIWRKNLWFTYIDNKYRASFELPLNQPTTIKHCVSFYDLSNDPKEMNPLPIKKNKKAISQMLEIINWRRDHIHTRNRSMSSFLSKHTASKT